MKTKKKIPEDIAKHAAGVGYRLENLGSRKEPVREDAQYCIKYTFSDKNISKSYFYD